MAFKDAPVSNQNFYYKTSSATHAQAISVVLRWQKARDPSDTWLSRPCRHGAGRAAALAHLHVDTHGVDFEALRRSVISSSIRWSRYHGDVSER